MDLEQQLRAALVPTRLGPQVRAAVMVRLAANPGRRGPNGWVLSGVVLALAAAAAMLAMRLREPDASALIADSSPGPTATLIDTDNAIASLDTAEIGVLPAAEGKEAQPVAATIKPFTVQVLPLKSHVADVPRKAAIEAVYAELVAGLRAVPGLTLVELATDEPPARLATDYRITLKDGVAPPGTSNTGDYFVNMIAERAGADGRQAGATYIGKEGRIAPGCASPASMDVLASHTSCADPTGVAAELLATLRKGVFPPDPQLRQRLETRLLDQALNPAERLQALVDLGSLGRYSGAYRVKAFAPTLRDPAVIRAAIQLASTTPDPAARAQVWYTLRGSRDTELVRPLVTALRTDADDDTRVQALATLAADFATDPQVRIALEMAAARDSHPMVRALAGRALGAESAWTEYVQASLKDASRSPVERIEAFFYAYGLDGPFVGNGGILRALDDAAMRALAEVLPKAAAESERYARSSPILVSELSSIAHPAITDLLLDVVINDRRWYDRGYAVEALRRRTADPEVRGALEKIAAEDANPRVRELVAKLLDPEEKSVAATPGPLLPRLGVIAE